MSHLTAAPPTAALLRQVRDRLAAPGAWLQGMIAQDFQARRVDPESQLATGWCLAGAIISVCGHGETSAAVQQALRAALGVHLHLDPRIMSFSVVHWQDQRGRTQEDVLALLDAAIARAERDAS